MQRRSSLSKDSARNALNSSLRRYAATGTAIAIALSGCISPPQRAARDIFAALSRNQPVPLAHRIDETLTIAQAYRIQSHIVRRRLAGATPGGFKAGLTSAPSQARFRSDGPIAGVLYASGLRPSGDTLRLSELRGLNIETEVALRIGTPIEQRLDSIAALQSHIDGIAPAVELPNLDYTDPQQLNGLDIVASNVAAAAYMVGEFVAPAARDPNAVTTRLSCEGKELNAGKARDALGDQWQAALWLVNTMIDQGWTLQRGQILLTGALGRIVPAQSGHCIAGFGDWGTIELDIVP